MCLPISPSVRPPRNITPPPPPPPFTKSVRRLDRPDVITWVSWLTGEYVLVGSVDTVGGVLACYDYVEGRCVTERRFPGAIDGAKIFVGKADNYIAVGIGGINPSISIVSLVRCGPELVFKSEAHLREYAMPIAIHGDLLLCGARNGIGAPHLLHWRTGISHRLTDNLDTDTEGSIRAAIMSNEVLVIVESRSITVYILDNSLDRLSVQEIARCSLENSTSSATIVQEPDRANVLSFAIAISYNSDEGKSQRCDLETWVVAVHLGEYVNQDTPVFFRKTGCCDINKRNSGNILHVAQARSGRQLLVIYGPFPITNREVQCYSVQCPTTDAEESGAITELQLQPLHIDADLPAIWADVSLDCVDTYGLLVLGNIFGELAVASWYAEDLEVLPSSSFDVIPHISPHEQEGASLTGYESPLWHTPSSLSARAALLRGKLLVQPKHHVGDGWQTACPDYYLAEGWTGPDCTHIRSLRDCLNFAGDIAPLLYHPGRDDVLIYAGGVFVVYCDMQDEYWVARDGSLGLEELIGLIDEDPEGTGWGQHMVRAVFHNGRAAKYERAQKIWQAEVASGRNRWREQEARGGNPAKGLLPAEGTLTAFSGKTGARPKVSYIDNGIDK